MTDIHAYGNVYLDDSGPNQEPRDDISDPRRALSAMSYDDALELPRDEDGRITGYLVGKQRRIREWEERKEEARYKALFRDLYKKKWMGENGYRRAGYRESFERRHPGRIAEINKAATKRHRARTVTAAKRESKICQCRECGVEWCRVPGSGRGRVRRWCSVACGQRARHRGQADWRANPVILACVRCDAQWCYVPGRGRGGKMRRFCSKRCQRGPL